MTRLRLMALSLTTLLSLVLLHACSAEKQSASHPRTYSNGGTQTQGFAGSTMSSGRSGPAVHLISGPFDEIWIIATDGTRAQASRAAQQDADYPRGGELRAVVSQEASHPSESIEPSLVPMPLERTDVDARISGPISAVTVKQRFGNPYDSKIEAVYVFPLPHDSAVSDFVMTIGERRIRGLIRERESAERTYAEARAQGHVASLLTEERPNIFTQRVANIEPGKSIGVEIVYFGVVGYEEGWHEFVFPMVVGPRFNPATGASSMALGSGIGAVPRHDQSGAGQGTAIRYLKPGERSGHDVDVVISIDAGTTIHSIASPSHRIDTHQDDSTRATVRLAVDEIIPDRDFVLRWKVAGATPIAALASSRSGSEGHFVLSLYPPEVARDLPAAPLELVFVVDCSGSMEGVPLKQAQNAMRKALAMLRPHDTFQIIEFSDTASSLGANPLAANEENIAAARRHVDRLHAGGGTMMINGVRTALSFPHDPERVRYVIFLTDGFIGNEAEVLAETHRLLGASRLFTFGVGSSVNRYLLHAMATLGQGATTVLLDREDGAAVMSAFMQRTREPILHDVRIDFGDAFASEVFPRRLPDLHAGKPVVIVGRSPKTGPASLAINARIGHQSVRIPVGVDFASQRTNDGLEKIWARAQMADLSLDALRAGATSPQEASGFAQQILAVSLRHSVLSPYSAFIAVDSSIVTEGTSGTTVHQGVPVPQGVKYETTVQRTR